MAELTTGAKRWADERKAILNMVDKILEEITFSQGGEIHIKLEICCAPTIDYSVRNVYVVPRGNNE